MKVTNNRYAHRNLTSLIVNEFVIDNSASDEDFTFKFKQDKDQAASKDIDFQFVGSNWQGVGSVAGMVNHAEQGDKTAKVAYSYTTISDDDIVVPNNTVIRFNFLATFRASF